MPDASNVAGRQFANSAALSVSLFVGLYFAVRLAG